MLDKDKTIAACTATLAVFAWLVSGGAVAQSYPLKPVRMVVGFVAGGGADVTARIVGQKLTEALGQQIVIENRPGAGSALATEKVAASPPDGYTVLLLASSGVLQPTLRPTAQYQIERDLAPVSLEHSFSSFIHPFLHATSRS